MPCRPLLLLALLLAALPWSLALAAPTPAVLAQQEQAPSLAPPPAEPAPPPAEPAPPTGEAAEGQGPGEDARALPAEPGDQPQPDPAPPPGPAAPGQTAPPAAEPPRPFGRHTMNGGLAFSFGVAQDLSFNIGGSFGYFVLDGLEPGLSVDVTFGPEQHTVVSLLGYLRYILWRSFTVSPFLRVQGGRWFIVDGTDIAVVGPSVGLVYFLTSYLGLQAEGGFLYLVPDQGPCPGDSCFVPLVGLSLGIFFNPMVVTTAPGDPR